jgi:hypothetical protein
MPKKPQAKPESCGFFGDLKVATGFQLKARRMVLLVHRLTE